MSLGWAPKASADLLGQSGARWRRSATMAFAMRQTTRREFLGAASAAAIGASCRAAILRAAALVPAPTATRFCRIAHAGRDSGVRLGPGDGDADGGGCGGEDRRMWRGSRFRRAFVYSASELDSFEGKPTGEVASFRVMDGELQPLSARELGRHGHLPRGSGCDGTDAARRRLHRRERGQLSH